MTLLLALANNFQGYLTDTTALAAVALIGYLFGNRTHKWMAAASDSRLHQELVRATGIAKDLQQIATRIRQDVASHQSNIAQFKARLENLHADTDDEGWQKLSAEAEMLLKPTMKLATDMSLAYDQLRKQTLQLMNFTGSRTDQHTGIFNRNAMEEQLEVLFLLYEQNKSRFSLALFSVDWCEEETDTHSRLRDFAELLQGCARDTDIVSRYSPEEFVILMPQTSLAGATIFSERLMRSVKSDFHMVLAGGIVEVQQSDDAEKILSRADSALYSARANGYSCLYQHVGQNIRPHEMAQTASSKLESAN
ncbi:MAG: GGDEF domain-containing protein [Pirellulales bacterium]|nr:GGDEF domain-containing protein [Pirellulales bacterium]